MLNVSSDTFTADDVLKLFVNIECYFFVVFKKCMFFLGIPELEISKNFYFLGKRLNLTVRTIFNFQKTGKTIIE